MEVRHARPHDAEAIHEMAESLKIDYINPQPQGFLIYILDEERYTHRIKVSNYFYVAEVDNCVVGFLMCYDNETLLHLRDVGEIEHEGNIPRFVLQQQTPYIYVDQIGVRKTPGSRGGVGKSMMETLFEDMRALRIPAAYVGIVHGPVRNHASIHFFQKLHFEEITEIDNGDGYTSGIYRLNLF